MTGRRWIRERLIEKGRDWTMQSGDQFREDTGLQWNDETFRRDVRRVARSLKQKIDPSYPDPPKESHQVRTLDDSLDYHEANESDFEIRKVIQNTYGTPTNPGRQVKVEMVPRSEPEVVPDEMAERFRELVGGYAGPVIESVPQPTSGQTMELSLPDLHIGKIIWGELTGGSDFTLEDSRRLYMDAIINLTAGFEGQSFQKVLLPLGNDFFNIDNMMRTTTKGTQMVDTAHPMRMFDMGLLIAVDAVYYLSRFGPVRIVIIPGNHDRLMSYVLGWALQAWFREMDTVEVDNEPKLQKAYGSGFWGVVWHHGDKLKPHDLAMLFADEFPQLWARTAFREVHQGHLHHVKDGEFRATDESNGVRVRLLPSLVPADEWHDKHRFRAVREGALNVWDDDQGLYGQRFYHPREVVA